MGFSRPRVLEWGAIAFSGEMGRGGINRKIGSDIYTLHIQNRQLIRTYCIAQGLDSVLHSGLMGKESKKKEWLYV